VFFDPVLKIKNNIIISFSITYPKDTAGIVLALSYLTTMGETLHGTGKYNQCGATNTPLTTVLPKLC
jgi:hypothetical protein